MSRCTVQRAITEGGVASQIQLGYKLAKADGFTASGDGTSHRNINYESRHVSVLVPSYSSDINANSLPSHHTRLVAVDCALNHTSETQIAGWKEHAQNIAEIFNSSPLSERSGLIFESDDFAHKIKGMNGDHAADQLKTARGIQDWKAMVDLQDLGYRSLASLLPEDLDLLLLDVYLAQIEAAGGFDTWADLSCELREHALGSGLGTLAMNLGKTIFEELPGSERRARMLFIRGGCCMHKDLNAVKGGNEAMQAAWSSLATAAPILLANKANANAIQRSEPGTSAAAHAISSSSRGGVKLGSLAGAIFNNKDDKKGLQDVHAWWFGRVKHVQEGSKFITKFPDTSNTRYGSHCEAAKELLVYRLQYIEFLEHVRDHKESRAFNHIEQNVYNGLRDMPTITELAVLALYAQTITHPYMCSARNKDDRNINLLDLKPLHDKVKAHIRTLIENPDLLLSDHSHNYATLDGEQWESPRAVAAIRALSPQMPFLRPLLIAFLSSALATWDRF
ncbi:hypothetical protein DENSPDRAFT_789674 [Dentipellis sp. KUC8613]|nr:hypothetical protein DENSPDRAFT_789674 [Dentipellis sp. KUC8613]